MNHRLHIDWLTTAAGDETRPNLQPLVCVLLIVAGLWRRWHAAASAATQTT